MSMLDSSLVRVAVTGGIFASLDGSGTLPAAIGTEIGTGFDELGYVGEGGITQSINADVTDIRAWQNGDTVRKVQTSHDVTYGLTFLETNPAVLEAYYGNHVAGHVEIRGDVLPRIPWVFDIFDDDQHIRLVIPLGQVTERGDITYQNGGAIGYPVTITAFPVDGVKAHLYYGEVDDG